MKPIRRVTLTLDIPEDKYQEACNLLGKRAAVAEIGCATITVIEMIAAAVLEAASKVEPK